MIILYYCFAGWLPRVLAKPIIHNNIIIILVWLVFIDAETLVTIVWNPDKQAAK